MKKQLHFWSHVLVACIILFSCKNDINSADKFHGMWRLVRYEAKDSASNAWRPDPTRKGLGGFVVYDGLGHMGVHQVKAPGDTSENNIDITYFAKYIVFESGVIQHTKVSSSFGDVGDDVKRSFEFRGDTLLLTPEEADGSLRVVWVKVTGR